VDLEMLDETAENREQRENRRAFYLRNGYQPTGHFLSYFGVDYKILRMDETFDFEMFRRLMEQLAVPGFRPKPKTRMAKPIPEMAPSAKLPYRAPTNNAVSTMRNSMIIKSDIIVGFS